VGAEDAALFSLDARGLRLAGNTIRAAGNNGILVWRSAPGDDGTLVVDNRIEDIAARAGGSGENGNAINVFRAGNVMVRGNRIGNAAFSGVRGNAAGARRHPRHGPPHPGDRRPDQRRRALRAARHQRQPGAVRRTIASSDTCRRHREQLSRWSSAGAERPIP